MNCECGYEINTHLGKFKPFDFQEYNGEYIYTCPVCGRAYQREKVSK